MQVQRCRSCGQIQPLREPEYSKYAGYQKRLRWKQVCNHCISTADARRTKKILKTATDERDRRHPLEDVVRAWVQT